MIVACNSLLFNAILVFIENWPLIPFGFNLPNSNRSETTATIDYICTHVTYPHQGIKKFASVTLLYQFAISILERMLVLLLHRLQITPLMHMVRTPAKPRQFVYSCVQLNEPSSCILTIEASCNSNPFLPTAGNRVVKERPQPYYSTREYNKRGGRLAMCSVVVVTAGASIRFAVPSRKIVVKLNQVLPLRNQSLCYHQQHQGS